MKLSKKTLNLLLLVVVTVVSYFFGNNNPKESQPAEQKNHISQTNNRAASNVETKQAVAGDYDSVMREDKIGQNKNAPVHYYMLALSWSPSFCDSQADKNNGYVPQRLQYQCAGSQDFGWVIHGLWPQNKNARSINEHPRYCQGDLPPVSAQIIEKYLPESPGAALLQGEWEKHGACAFDNAETYFAKQKELFNALVLPNKNMRKNELFRWMRKNNPHLERVYLGASKTELYICYDKAWQPVDCPK